MTTHPFRERCGNFPIFEREPEQQGLSWQLCGFIHDQKFQYDTKCIFKVLMIDLVDWQIDWHVRQDEKDVTLSVNIHENILNINKTLFAFTFITFTKAR